MIHALHFFTKRSPLDTQILVHFLRMPIDFCRLALICGAPKNSQLNQQVIYIHAEFVGHHFLWHFFERYGQFYSSYIQFCPSMTNVTFTVF